MIRTLIIWRENYEGKRVQYFYEVKGDFDPAKRIGEWIPFYSPQGLRFILAEGIVDMLLENSKDGKTSEDQS